MPISWRDLLKAQRGELNRQYPEMTPVRYLRAHCKLIDDLLQDIWTDTAMPASLTLIAVGGYGRGELFPHSDVDLLILLPGEVDTVIQEKLETLISLLWDTGLEVGHSVRTVDECLEEGARDISIQTNLLEARFLTGNRELFTAFHLAYASHLDPKAFYEGKLLEQQQRHTRFHDTAYNLEPNLKESPGGLRDIQTVAWIARALGIESGWRGMVREHLVTAREAAMIRRHEKLLQNLRIRLHLLAGRREDRIVFDHQPSLAEQFGFSTKKLRSASEQLMQRYYRTAKAVMVMNEVLIRSLHTRIFSPLCHLPEVIDENFQARDRLLEIRDEALFQNHPSAILDLFLVMEQHPELKGINAATLRALWRAAPSIDAAFRRSAENRRRFVDFFRQPHGITHELRRMNQFGVLGRYLPNFGRIVGQMQHDLFHVYTVDEHILFVVRNLRRFTVPEYAHEFPLCSRLISGFERPEILYLAGLFHDVAKGRGGDHSRLGALEVRRFCRSHGIAGDDEELMTWLVENHLVMSATAQKQDVSDPDVIAAFAARVRDMRHLTGLYLLTVADVRGTSPKVWNAWKGRLLESLFLSTRRYLSGENLGPEAYLQERQLEALKTLRLYAIPEQAHLPLWKQLDDGYFLRHEAQEIAWQTRLLYRHVDSPHPIVRARLSPTGAGVQVLIYTPDRDDLFARICSFFERTDFNIVEAKVCTTRHGYALDSFVVLDQAGKSAHYRDLLNFIEHELTERLTRLPPLEAPLDGRLSRHLKHFPITPEISIRPDEKGAYHVLSVVAGDRTGLLSRIAQIFLRHGIHLHTAKITTLGERAEDTFLIQGENLDQSKTALRLETELLRQLQTQH
ncbi:MAG: [protein-PII] uridylyltransferase [Sulfuricella sp.]|nr:[protein-PII] uridylyltransferase [Sulfuricella sp.]